MFYSLSTKIPHIMTGKKLLKIFTVGSICYIVSNYFLQLNKSSEKLKIINKYFYYAMAIDLVIASILVKFHKSEELEDDDINREINKTVDEVIKIQNENNAEKSKTKPEKSDKSDKSLEQSESESEKPEESIQDESESVSLSLSSNKKNKKSKKEKEKQKENKKDKHSKKNKKQSQNTDTDTQIPVFVNS